jgi:23S rRNA (cytidine1920-2'-O)/16S rRNA (cytidine1409-2'-O)-methyltransferase
MPRVHRKRLDATLAEAGLAESEARAGALIMAGRVRVAGATVRQPAHMVAEGEPVELVAPPPYVSRGGEKLAPALDAFGVDVKGRVCADIGASTGGFTDVLLQRGATRVYAVDVGRGQLDWKLRQDPRVVVMEGVNARHLERFGEPVGLCTVDVSFIGLAAVLPALRHAAPGAELVVLFKPQFEVRREQVGRGGVVEDPEAVEEALARLRAWCAENGFRVRAQTAAAVRGPAGNQELLLQLEMVDP